MAEIVPDRIRGLLLHDPRFCEANRALTTTEAAPTFGTPAASGSTPRARLEAWTGASDAAGGTEGSGYDERWVECIRAGGSLPGSGAARILWSDADPASAEQRGWMPPKVVMDFQWARYESATLTYHQPHAIELADRSLLLAYVREVSGASTTIRCIRVAPESAPGSEVEIADDTYLTYGLADYDTGPALVQLPDGRVLCFYLTRRNSILLMNVRASEDNGATWVQTVKEAGGFALTGITASAGLRVVYHGGYLTCVVQIAANQAYHYASADMGASWSAISGDSPLNARGACLVALPDGGVGMLYVEDSHTYLRFTTKSGPFAPFNTTSYIRLVVSTAFNIAVDIDNERAYIAACVAQDGSIYCAFRSSGSSPGCRIKLIRFNPIPTADSSSGYSTDLLWEDIEAAAASWDSEPLTWGDDNERMIGLTLAPHLGGLRLISGYEGSVGAKTGSLGMLTLGGWSTQVVSGVTFGMYNDATQYGIAYVPFTLASLVAGWTRTGASVATLTSTGYNQSFAGAATDYYSVTGGDSGYLFALFTHTQNSGGSLTADDSFVHALCTDGATTEHNVKIRFSSTGARMVDLNNASATLGSDLSGLTAGTAYNFMIYMNLDTVYVWYKLTTATAWTLWQSVTPTSASVAASALFEWGTSSTNASNATWAFVGVAHYADPVVISHSTVIGITGRPLGTLPVYVSAGLSVRATRAPVMGGDLWQIPLRYGYGADTLDPLIQSSPRRGWRSTATTAQIIKWDMGTTAPFDCPAIGLHVSRPLCETVTLQGSANDSTWTDLITLDTTEGLAALDFTRSGDTIRRNGGDTSATYVQMDELVGGYVVLTSGGTDYVRPILSNSEGVWRATGRQLSIRIDDPNGTAPASGKVAIIRPAATRIAWAVTTGYRYYRLNVAALTQDADSPGYLALGAVTVGPLLVFGRQYSQGRTVSASIGQEVTTLTNGARSVQNLAPVRRAVEFSWAEANINTDQLYAAIPAQDYVAAVTSGSALASRHSDGLIEGALRRQVGARLPVVYLPSLAYEAAGSSVLIREGQMYGSLISDVHTRVAALGNETEDELVTIGTVRIEELV